MAALEKKFDCMQCHAPIKLERDQKNNKWIRYELDGKTEHKCNKKQQQPQQQYQNQQTLPRSELADVQDEVAGLEALIKTLVSQVQLLRQEVQQQKK
jgi:nucleotidyltransferase/DNA polymerase involved in DNA repair